MLCNTTQNVKNIWNKCLLLDHSSTQNSSLLYFYWSKEKYLALTKKERKETLTNIQYIEILPSEQTAKTKLKTFQDE